jgi:EAL domain-containing protein (putative c-di-GMP-specific phosphodiesterase class I)
MTALLIDRVMAPGALTARFQPVAEAAPVLERVCYLEGLVRGPEGTNLESADVLFSYIRNKGETARMDRLCVSTVLAAAEDLPGDVCIGLNVEATTLVSDLVFPEYLRCVAASYGVIPSRLVIEIVEQTWPADVRAFRSSVAELRAMGMRIALDDIGRAHSNYRMMLETRPDFFKIDRYFVSGAHADPLRREVLRSIADLARSFGARVVAEGIEEPADLDAVRTLGIELVQGFLVSPLVANAPGSGARRRAGALPAVTELKEEGRC